MQGRKRPNDSLRLRKRRRQRFQTIKLFLLIILCLFAIAWLSFHFGVLLSGSPADGTRKITGAGTAPVADGSRSAYAQSDDAADTAERTLPALPSDFSEVPQLFQWDPRWGDKLYGSDTMRVTGCGPTCMSMLAMYFLHDTSLTPDVMADFAMENGYYSEGNGTKWTFMTEGAAQLGITGRELPLDEERLCDALLAGYPVVIVVGPGSFTDVGHFLILYKYEDGAYFMRDPNTASNSDRSWHYEEFAPEIRNMWAMSYSGN